MKPKSKPTLRPIDLYQDPRFRYYIGDDARNNTVRCTTCRFAHCDTYLQCQSAATDHVKQGHWSEK